MREATAPGTRFLFVRHGATEWNRDGRFQGHTDLPLSEEGRAQARALAHALRDERIDRVGSSDLARAAQTAHSIAACHALAVETDARWREFDFGEWEGHTWQQIVAGFPALATHSPFEPRRYAPQGGESFYDVRTRVASALQSYEGDGDTIVVVSHAGPIHAALDILLGSGASRVRLLPASITEVAVESGVGRLLTTDPAQANSRADRRTKTVLPS